jgi:peptidoglycan/LPS O-acetylase OafA/YrhL
VSANLEKLDKTRYDSAFDTDDTGIVDRLNTKPHFYELDGVRGVAILLVLLFHTFPAAAIPNVGKFLVPFFSSMWVGVDLFFVLSGFLITRILLSSKQSPDRFSRFYLRRALRIFPLYYLSLTLALFVLPRFALPEMRQLQPLWPWFYSYSINIWVFIINDSLPTHLLNHYWSLAVEEQFYLFWPLIIFSLQRRRLPIVILYVCTAAILARAAMIAKGYSWSPLYVNLFTRMDSFALGALATYAYVYKSDAITDRRAKYIVWAAGLSLILLFVALKGFEIGSRLSQFLVFPIIAMFFSAGIYLLLRCSKESIFKRFFSHSALRFLGKYSYGIYIYHWIIFHYIASIPAFKTQSLPSLLALFGLANAITLIAAMVSFHGFESHFLKLKPKIKLVAR